MKKIKMIVEKTNTGYSAYAEAYPVYTTAQSLLTLKKNLLESLNLYFEHQKKTITPMDMVIQLDIPQFFTFYKVINAKALSERIGMNQSLLAQYIKGHKKPSIVQTEKILKGIREVGKELAEMDIK